MFLHPTLRAAAVLLFLASTTACGGGGSSSAAPSNLQYAIDPAVYIAGAAIAANVPSIGGGAPSSFTAVPALPGGLTLDQTTGTITGTPAAEASTTAHVITAMNASGQTSDTVTVAVIPAVFESLAAGFVAETVHSAPAMTPVKHGKVAVAPAGDDRVFFTEVDTGNVRVIDPTSGLEATPFATIDVLNGGHNGLLGLALAPDFGTSNTPYVYVLACVPGDGMAMTVDRIQVLRYTAAGNVGTNETVMIDDLPVSPPMGINNGGELVFDLAGNLFLSLGDVGVEANAQADSSTSLAGKVLRYDVSTVPAVAAAGNPVPMDPEWCRGIRNTFGMAVHPTAGGLFAVDNGPAADDELNFLQAGKNFEWGGSPPPPETGFKIKNWQTVIVPTGLCWHDGTAWGAAYANNLFLCTYEDHTIERFAMSGDGFVDIDSESTFAAFVVTGDANHPLDICTAPDGSLYVSTFIGIYRITKLP